MKAEKVDALLVTRREDVRYLTGFTGSAGFGAVSLRHALPYNRFPV